MEALDPSAFAAEAPYRHGHGRPRILRVATRLNHDPGRHAVQMATAIRELGFETRLVSGGSGPDGDDIDPPPGVAHTYVPWLGHALRPGDDLRATVAIAGVVRRWRPDIVHSHLPKAGTLARAVAIQAGVPVVMHTFHDRVLKDYLSALRNAAFSKIERSLAARTDALVAVAPWIRDELLGAGIGRPGQWHIVATGEGCASELAGLYRALLNRAAVTSSVPGRTPAVSGHVPV